MNLGKFRRRPYYNAWGTAEPRSGPRCFVRFNATPASAAPSSSNSLKAALSECTSLNADTGLPDAHSMASRMITSCVTASSLFPYSGAADRKAASRALTSFNDSPSGNRTSAGAFRHCASRCGQRCATSASSSPSHCPWDISVRFASTPREDQASLRRSSPFRGNVAMG